ncbi:MAG: hypothetical protein AAGF54_17125 [Pseudomonadota bacterium]
MENNPQNIKIKFGKWFFEASANGKLGIAAVLAIILIGTVSKGFGVW